MISKLTPLLKTARELPFGVNILCHGGMVLAPLFVLALILPLSDWEVNGQLMSYHDLWRSGVGPVFSGFFFILGLGCWGMAARKRWARWVLVIMMPASFLIMALFPYTRAWLAECGTIDLVFGFLFYPTFFYALLFHLPGMRRHYQAAAASAE